MKYKKVSFSILEEIEKKKIKKETVNIKNLYLKKRQIGEQLKILIHYQKDYIKKIHNKIISGVCVHQWQNYKNFISILESIIKDNINNIEKNNKMIQKSLNQWSKNQIKLKVWKHLNIINEKKILRIKKIQEEIINNDFAQLKFFKKG